MSSFDDRQKAQEAKYANDEAFKFKVTSRRNKLLGLWAAELLGHENPNAYVSEVVAADFEEAGDDDVVRKIMKDFGENGVTVTEDEVRSKIASFHLDALHSMDA